MSDTTPGTSETTAPTRSVSVRTGPARFKTQIQIGRHAFVADEPPEVGGADAGASPYDMLCAALASCTTITAMMYADRKGWPLKEVAARVDHYRRKDEGTTPPSISDVFAMSLDFIGELDEAQRTRLLEIAGRCPVHRTLVAGAIIEMGAV